MKKIIPFSIFLFSTIFAFAQEDLLSLVGEDSVMKEPVIATFKSNRIVTGHSVETLHGGVFDMKIQHRFGALNGGFYQLFGLDQASIRIGGDIGITNNLCVGFGRNSVGKVYDGFVKYKIISQKSNGGFPVTITAMQSMAISSLKWADPTRTNYFSSRLFYTTQVMVARKFNESFSLQLTPTYVHRNLVARATDKNDVYAMGIGFRQKLTKRFSINGEYFYVFPGLLDPAGTAVKDRTYHNSLSIGVDIETGGHVFQLQFTNSLAMIEKGFVAETTESWLTGGIHFGFNVTRVFNIYQWDKKF